jgi:hypothetical protein
MSARQHSWSLWAWSRTWSSPSWWASARAVNSRIARNKSPAFRANSDVSRALYLRFRFLQVWCQVRLAAAPRGIDHHHGFRSSRSCRLSDAKEEYLSPERWHRRCDDGPSSEAPGAWAIPLGAFFLRFGYNGEQFEGGA